MMAQVTGLEVGEFVHSFGDVHIYSNHFEQVDEQLSGDMKELPEIKINPEIKNIDDFKYEDFEVINYESHPPLKAEITNFFVLTFKLIL
jgi:thymidylate synthase